jgi:hypothetical protein
MQVHASGEWQGQSPPATVVSLQAGQIPTSVGFLAQYQAKE